MRVQELDSTEGLGAVLGTVCTMQVPALILNLSVRDEVREGLVIDKWWSCFLSHAQSEGPESAHRAAALSLNP